MFEVMERLHVDTGKFPCFVTSVEEDLLNEIKKNYLFAPVGITSLNSRHCAAKFSVPNSMLITSR